MFIYHIFFNVSLGSAGTMVFTLKNMSQNYIFQV